MRLVSATHYRIDPGADSARFRQDLFFRISGITITVPPLRERPNDLPLLLANEVALAAKVHGKSIVGLSRPAADRLLAYRWPGNLRELSSVIHAAVALTHGEVIGEEMLLLVEDTPSAAVGPPTDAGGRAPRSGNGRLLRDAVHRHIATVLSEVGGNKRKAARELGVSRATLERKLREAQPGARPRAQN